MNKIKSLGGFTTKYMEAVDKYENMKESYENKESRISYSSLSVHGYQVFLSEEMAKKLLTGEILRRRMLAEKAGVKMQMALNGLNGDNNE